MRSSSGFYGVDEMGREWRLDPYTWSPVFDSILQTWITMIYGELSPSQQHDTGRFLLAKANEARAALVDGKRIGFDRRLGILSCPYWWRLPRWRNVPPRPYRALRVYRMEFIVGEMARNHDRVSPTLMMESEP